MVGVACPPSMGREGGRHGWLGRRRRWRWTQRTGRGPGGWPACARPRLSPGVFGSRFPPQTHLFKTTRQNTPRREARPAAPTSRRLRFSVTSPPGRRGTKPPASLRGTMENGPTGQTRSSNPPPGCGGGLRQGPQASAWGLTVRKDAVWAEGLADGAPWARPGHHQAASCGLRRCRELRVVAKTDRS